MSKQPAAIDATFVKQQRKRLIAMRDELLSANAAADAAQRAPRIKEAEEIEDDAQLSAQSDVDQAVGAVETQRLRLIERALTKIDDGTYGFSDLSGDPIPRARLNAVPEALLTIEEEEARERRAR